jgi:hypothetical protein
MSIVNTIAKPLSPSRTLIENNDNDLQENVTFLQELHVKPRHSHQQNNMNTTDDTSTLPSTANRTPANLLEFKKQRLLAAADRKNRLITRIISIIGLLIILLCAIIVTLTLKMAPKIDELVRNKAGAHPLAHLMSRMTTPLTTIELNNFTTNYSLITKSLFRTRRRSFI